MAAGARSTVRGRAAVLATAVVVSGLFVISPAPAARADSTSQVERAVGSAGPLGAVTVVGDSVMFGSKDSLPESLVAAGFGPIRYRAVLGANAGNRVDPSHPFNTASWIDGWRAGGWDAPTVLVNLGANDVGYCYDSTACAEEGIRFLLDRIGPGHTVMWPTISHKYPEWAAAWNAALSRVAADEPDLVVWDWPAARIAAGIPIAADNIHLPHSAAYARRSTLLTDALVDAVSRSVPSGQPPVVPVAVGAPSDYVPVPPRRVLDTRSGVSALRGGETLQVDLGGSIPAGAVAAAVNLTATDAVAPGYLTAWPCATARPGASNVNFDTAGARGALAIVSLSGGTLCLFSPVDTHVLVDLQGAFVPAEAGSSPVGYATLAQPTRLIDTRGHARPSTLRVQAPAGATAVTVNLTATDAVQTGYLGAAPCGAVPEVSNVNFTAGETVAGAAFVPVGADGTFCVTAVGEPHVLVDLTGTFGPDGTLRFMPAAPTRVLDTRTGVGGWTGRVGSRQRIRVSVAPPGARAMTGTVTAVDSAATGYASLGATLPAVPTTSDVNVGRGATIANSFTASVAADGSLDAEAAAPMHLLIDVTGWWSS